jgi:hypothetical protein
VNQAISLQVLVCRQRKKYHVTLEAFNGVFFYEFTLGLGLGIGLGGGFCASFLYGTTSE